MFITLLDQEISPGAERKLFHFSSELLFQGMSSDPDSSKSFVMEAVQVLLEP